MNNLQRIFVLSLCTCICTSAIAATPAAEILTIAAAGELTATQADGTAIWKVRLAEPAVPTWERGAGGALILENGTVIDALGRIVARRHDLDKPQPARDGGRDAECPYWSDLEQIMPPEGANDNNSHNSPLFDSAGNAWVINTHLDFSSGVGQLQIRRSNGHDGTWQPLENIASITHFAGPNGAIDMNDNIMIVFRDAQSNYELYAMRYEPGNGWAGPDLVYSTATFFQTTEIAADSQGNFIAVFDPEDTVWSMVYDAASGTWGASHQVSPAGYQIVLPTVVANDAHDAIYLIYMVTGGGPAGLYAHRFNSATQSWGPAEYLPGTESVGFDSTDWTSRFPAAVGPFGEATVFWQSAYPGPYGVYGSRTQGGVWQAAHELLAPGPNSTDMVNFAHADANQSGDAFGAITRSESWTIHFYAFRYRAGSGWDPAENPYSASYFVTTRTRIAAYRGSRAVATLLAPQDDTPQITSLLYDGASWTSNLLDIPQTYRAYFQEMEPDRGEPLLVFEAGPPAGDDFGIQASWLRDQLGDLDGDCDVDIDDFDSLADCLTGPENTYPPDCDDSDLDDDHDVDLDDFAAFQEVFGQGQ